MWLELTVLIARLDEMMNMQVTGYWSGESFWKAATMKAMNLGNN